MYKELMPMKKEQVDLGNGVAWIPDSKTPNGIAEVPGCKPDSCARSINAGIDMVMVPEKWKSFIANTVEQVRQGRKFAQHPLSLARFASRSASQDLGDGCFLATRIQPAIRKT